MRIVHHALSHAVSILPNNDQLCAMILACDTADTLRDAFNLAGGEHITCPVCIQRPPGGVVWHVVARSGVKISSTALAKESTDA